MLENSTTVRAESVEKAIQIGLNKLGAKEADAKINVISEGKKGLFGFGKQDAIVEISIESDLSMAELTNQLEQQVNGTHTKVASKPAPAAKPVPEKKTQAPVKRAEVKKSEPAKKHSKPVQAEAKAPVAPKAQPQAVKEKPRMAEKEPREKVADQPQSVNSSESRQIVARYLTDVIRAYGAEADITVEDRGYQVIFNIETNKSGLVIGKHGKIINALQTLAQIMLHRHDRRRVSVLLNVGDYRDRRSNVLEQIAQRTAEQVLRTKQQVILDPLPAYERKQIHAYLSKIDRIKTHSEGKDPNRYLVVQYVNQ